MSQILTLLAKVREFTSTTNDLVKTKPPHAVESVNTAALAGASKTSIKTSALTTVNAHIANKDNPHGVTLNSIGGVSKAYVDNALSETLSLSELPMSQFGDTTDDPLGVTSSGWTLRFTKPIAAYIQGVSGMLAAQNVNLSDIDANPAEKVFYVYLQLEDGIPAYRVTLQKLPESEMLMYLGSVYTGTAAIASTSIDRVSRVGIYRINHLPAGSSIPVTGGTFEREEQIDLGWTMADGSSEYIAYDTLNPPTPFIAVTDDGRGRVVYDGGMLKFTNGRLPTPPTQFSDLPAAFKYLYNAVLWVADPAKVAQGHKRVLILGDSITGYNVTNYTSGTSFGGSFTRLLDLAGFQYTVKNRGDYPTQELDVTSDELDECALVILVSAQENTPRPDITDQCVSNLAAFRHNGGGFIVITDHGIDLPTLESAKGEYGYRWFRTANKVVTRFGAWFSGNYSRAPVNVGYIRQNYGDHPLYAGMTDDETIHAGATESRVFVSG